MSLRAESEANRAVVKQTVTNRGLVLLAFSVMVIFGLVENLKGPVVPAIMTQFNVSYSVLGLALSLAYPGYLLACFAGGLAARRFGLKAILSCGFLMVAAGSLLMAVTTSVWAFCLFLFIINFGFGCFEVGANSLGAQIFVRNTAVLMNLMHLFYGVGSSAGPAFSGAVIARGLPWHQAYTWSTLATLLVFGYLLLTRFPTASNSEQVEHMPFRQVISDRCVWLCIGTLGFAEVIELGIGNWLVNFLEKVYAFPEARAAALMSLFFIAFSTGRIIGGFFAERVGYTTSILYAAILYFVFFALGLALGPAGAVFFSLTGLPVSIMFPTMMAILMREYKENVSAVMGMVITMSGVVNMVFKDLVVGSLNDMLGVYGGFTSFLLWTALVVVFLIPLRRRLHYRVAGQPF